VQFQDELAAGIVLIRPALRSPDFVTGSTGWSINQDGSAEFNDITIRAGTVISGTSLYYTPSPGAGNLFMSLADAAGTDDYGNTYPKGLSVGSDTTRQIVLDFAANVAFMQFSVNNGNAANSGTLLEAIVNEGDADEYLSMQAHSPAVVGFTDRIQLQLNSQNLDGSSEANAVFQHSTAGNLLTLDPDVITAGPILRVVRAAAGNNALSVRVTGDTNSRLLVNADGSVSWGAGGGSAVDTNLYRSAADTLRTDDSFTVGGNLTVIGVGQVQYARRTSDLSRNASGATDDTQLTFPVVANAVYALVGWVKYSALDGADINVDWSAPAGALGEWTAHGNGFATTAQTTNGYQIRTETTDVTAARAFSGTTATAGEFSLLIMATLRTGANAGTSALQWAQNVTDAANPTTVYTDSWLRLERIA
jgi:hypothetical protein